MSLKEQLKKMREELLEDVKPAVPRLPFEKLQINYDPEVAPPGSYIMGGEKDDNGEWVTPPKVLGPKMEVIFLKEYGQYTYFDPQAERTTIKSNIFPKFKAKEAVDVYTGRPIAELREAYPQIRYNQITLVLVKAKDWQPAIWYLKGSSLKAYLDILREKKLRPEDYIGYLIFKLGTKKNKKGTVIYFTPVLDSIREPDDKDAKEILDLMKKSVVEFKKYVEEYNNANKQEQKEEEGGEVYAEDIEDIIEL